MRYFIFYQEKGDIMRTRQEIEKQVGFMIKEDSKLEGYVTKNIHHLILEVLLDIREQNERDKITYLTKTYSHEQDSV